MSDKRKVILFNLFAPGLGFFYQGKVWKAFFTGIPFLLLTEVFLFLIPFTGRKFLNFILIYLWYYIFYQFLLNSNIDGANEKRKDIKTTLFIFFSIYLIPMIFSFVMFLGIRVGIYKTTGTSEFPLIRTGECVLYYKRFLPRRGDLVVFKKQDKSGIARIIGLPGDKVEIDQNYDITINGVKISKLSGGELIVDKEKVLQQFTPYVESLEGKKYLTLYSKDVVNVKKYKFELKADQYLLLCDNRDSDDCLDSRTLNTFGLSDFMGRVGFVIFSKKIVRIGYPL